MALAAERLIDWQTALVVGRRVAGRGTDLNSLDRARLVEDFAEVLPQAESQVEAFTGLGPGGYRSRPWVMTRNQWIQANLRGFERLFEPLAKKLVAAGPESPLAPVRRRLLGAQVGGLLGYLGHRVIGQYDILLPPDDDGLIYFVGPNVAGIERKFRFPPREFRLWVSLHEVTHRLQFGGVPWLRGHLMDMMDTYLSSVELDPRWLMQRLKSAAEEVRSGTAEYRGFGWIFLLMTPDQRELVQKMQAVMALLEGHGNYVMNAVGGGQVPHARRFQHTLHERRHRRGVERAFQKAIGFDLKVRQYDLGERFVSRSVEVAGQAGFGRIWEGPDNLPTLEEIARPEMWVARVAAA
jgi:coenzyme F420 biosynthesis associated uncharacterized protein